MKFFTATKQGTTNRFALVKTGAVAVALSLILGIGCSSSSRGPFSTVQNTANRGYTSSCTVHGTKPVSSKHIAGCDYCTHQNSSNNPRNIRNDITANGVKQPTQSKKDTLPKDDELLGLPKLIPPVSNPQTATASSPIKLVSHTTVPPLNGSVFNGPVLNAPIQNDFVQGPILIPATAGHGIASHANFDTDNFLAVPQQIRSHGETLSLPPLRSKHYVADNRLQPQKDIVATLFPTMVNLTSQYNSFQNHCPDKYSEPTNIFVRSMNAPNTEQRNHVAQTVRNPGQIPEPRQLQALPQTSSQRFEPDNVFAAKNTISKTSGDFVPQTRGKTASPRAASGCARWSEEPTNIFFRPMTASNIRQRHNISNGLLVQPDVAQTPAPLTTPATQSTRQHPVPATGNYVSQTSYQRSATDQRQVLPLNSVAMSTELTKPWDAEMLRKRSPDGKTYRLVSDTQTDRIPPPSTGAQFESMEAAAAVGRQTVHAQQASGGNRLPIFDLGKNIAKELRPSTNRKWTQNHAIQQTATMNGNCITVHNIRYSLYESSEKYTTRYYDATFNLDEIQTLDIIIVPFRAAPRVAHVESSFGFADGRYLGMSIEARYEEGEKYDPVGAGLNQFELIYLFADERDLIRLGTDVHKNNVEVYRLRLEPKEVREIFVAATQRANKLAVKPEFYHPLKNSCVTNLIGHINAARPNAIPREYRTLLPGLMDGYLFDLGLLATSAKSFKEAKENAKVNWLVEKYGDLEYFSAGIRQNMY